MPTTDRNYWQTWSASLLFFVAFYTLLVPLPLYLADIGLPDWQIGLILGAFGAASLIGRPLAGLASDRFGYRQVMLSGAVALILGVAGVTLTTQPVLLFGLRLLQAGGYVAFTTASNALVAALASPGERKSLLTRFGAAANLAMTITPATINLLLPWLTLNGALWVAGCFALICGGLALQVQSPRPSHATRISFFAMFRTRRIVLPMVLAAVVGCGFGTFLQFLPLLAERRGNLASGPIFALYGGGIALTRFLIARWMDHGDQRLILSLGYGLLTVGLLCFALGYTWPIFALAALLVASGSGLLTGPLMNLSVEALPVAARGSAIAIYYLGFDLGIGGGAWLLAPVLEAYNVGGLFTAAAVIVAVGLPLVQAVGKSPAEDATASSSADSPLMTDK